MNSLPEQYESYTLDTSSLSSNFRKHYGVSYSIPGIYCMPFTMYMYYGSSQLEHAEQEGRWGEGSISFGTS